MNTTRTWVSNDPEITKELKRIDALFDKARENTKNLCLSDKIVALREANQERTEAIKRLNNQAS